MGSTIRVFAASVLLIAATAASAHAQEVTVAFAAYAQRDVDDLSVFGRPRMAELRLTVPLSDRFSLEPFVDVPSLMVGAQIRQRLMRLTRRDGSHAFLTYGVASLLIGHFGLGWQQRLADHFAFRSEVRLVTFHVVPVGAMFVAGVTFGR